MIDVIGRSVDDACGQLMTHDVHINHVDGSKAMQKLVSRGGFHRPIIWPKRRNDLDLKDVQQWSNGGRSKKERKKKKQRFGELGVFGSEKGLRVVS